jgi:hypothetical protein
MGLDEHVVLVEGYCVMAMITDCGERPLRWFQASLAGLKLPVMICSWGDVTSCALRSLESGSAGVMGRRAYLLARDRGGHIVTAEVKRLFAAGMQRARIW